jgi:hypothetical protein
MVPVAVFRVSLRLGLAITGRVRLRRVTCDARLC